MKLFAAILLCAALPQTAALRGYLRSEYQYRQHDSESLGLRLSTTPPAEMSPFLEGNLELKLATPEELLKLYVDAGLMLQLEGPLARLLLNETVVEVVPHEHLDLWAGKRRVSFATGLAFTPSDAINPRKDPIDPSLQREGRFAAGVSVPFDRVALHLLWGPAVHTRDDGVPDEVDFTRHAVQAALYLNYFESDLTLLYANVEGRHHGGASFSRYLVGDLELHAEALVQDGRDGLALPEVPAQAVALLHLAAPPRVETSGLYFKGLIGARYAFADSKGLAILEYYYNGAGLGRRAFDSLLRFADSLATAREQMAAILPAQALAAAPGLELDTLAAGELRRHYLAASVQGSELWDYFSPSLVCLWGLEDSSFLVSAALDYRLHDAVVLRAGVTAPLGAADTQLGIMPFQVIATARIWVYF